MDKAVFKVNGQEYQVGGEVSSDMTLLSYLRETLELRGTKYTCQEAGCGACIVSAQKSGEPPYAVNSCMMPITACHGLEITTIEEIGNKKKGYHVLQKNLAKNNGSQCGYCSPGWIMAMYSLLKNNPNRTMLEIEQLLSSNICRCTGYRPILETFRKFGTDAPNQEKITDIEDLNICKGKNACKEDNKCKENCNNDAEWCIVNKFEVNINSRINIKLKDGKLWYRVKEIKDIFEILKDKGDDSYMLVGGNTAKGVYPIETYPRILIDITGIKELKTYLLDQNLVIGAGMTISELIKILEKITKVEYFGYLQKVFVHLQKVAHVAVRNVGTIAGNLMMKHTHNSFPSDIYLLLETIGAQLTLISKNNVKQTVTMEQFLKSNMRGVVILNVMLPPFSQEYKLETYKIMPRRQTAKTILNAGFLFQLTKSNTVLSARIVYGGLSPSSRAYKTEKFLIGKELFTDETLQSALKILEKEMVVTAKPAEPPVEYRKKTALALFYKVILILCPIDKISPRYRSGAINLHDTRPLSQAQQFYTTNPAMYPVNQPIPKIDGLYQCAGEAFYSDDLPRLPREVFAAFTLSTQGSGDIISIDPKPALGQPGVIAFYSATDIPGSSNFTPLNGEFTGKEEIFCSGKVKYFNQPFGVIVAETKYIAEQAAKLVKVEYKNVRKQVIDIKDAIKDPKRVFLFKSTNATNKGNCTKKVIKGSNSLHGQCYFNMENIVSVIHPIEEGIKVFATSHFLDGLHVVLSKALKIDQSRVDIHVRHIGGSYGLKLTRNIQSAAACGLVVQKLNRPCRFILSFVDTTRSLGKRRPHISNFELGVDNCGVIQYMNYDIYLDFGHVVNEISTTIVLAAIFNSCYDKSTWNFNCYNVTTDTSKNSWFRAPGTFEAITSAELIMERISYELSLDPVGVRLKNIATENYKDITGMYEMLKKDATYDERRLAVNKFNKANRWKKRGLRFSFFKWQVSAIGNFNVVLSVFQGDGTVVISHGATEMGQGANTIATQVCAYYLKIPMEKIQVKGSNTITNPNSDQAAASITSQNVSVGVQKCCKELLRRLEPIRAELKNANWEDIISVAYKAGVDLQTQSHISPNDVEMYPYNVFGIGLAEVEIDVLTGELEILRVDVVEDVGQSVSPIIDIGQIEGAFIMGLGYWTSEKLRYAETGELLTDRTWNYSVPLCTDIPQDFRVHFREKSYSYDIFYGAKAVGEPPLCLSICVYLAIREAISEARSESGIARSQWFPMDGPATVDVIGTMAETNTKDFKLL